MFGRTARRSTMSIGIRASQMTSEERRTASDSQLVEPRVGTTENAPMKKVTSAEEVLPYTFHT